MHCCYLTLEHKYPDARAEHEEHRRSSPRSSGVVGTVVRYVAVSRGATNARTPGSSPWPRSQAGGADRPSDVQSLKTDATPRMPRHPHLVQCRSCSACSCRTRSGRRRARADLRSRTRSRRRIVSATKDAMRWNLSRRRTRIGGMRSACCRSAKSEQDGARSTPPCSAIREQQL